MTTVAPGTSRRYTRRPPAWAALASAKVGLRPETLEHMVKGRCEIARRFAALVESAVVLGDRRLLDRLMAPVDAAMAKLPEELPTPVLICEVQAADLAEDMAESAHLLTPTPETLTAWIHTLRAQRASSLRLLIALEAV